MYAVTEYPPARLCGSFVLEHQLIITTTESPVNDSQALPFKSFSASRLLISHGIPRSGHLTDFEESELFNKAVLDFLWRKP
jgi:pimeloyl-ACP methyl ester carboxylesterase